MSATSENRAETPTRTRVMPFVIGAYPTLPSDDEDRSGATALYAAPGDLGRVDGIELPFREALGAPGPWLAEQLAGHFSQCVITAIPGTMGHTGANPVFGLVSPDDDGRTQALTYTRSLLKTVGRLHETAGEQFVTQMELHSALHHQATPKAFHTSLSELSEDFISRGLGMIMEHRDAKGGVDPSEEVFLTLTQEIVTCRDAATLTTVNWGRSVIKTHSPSTPESHVREPVRAGLLGSVMISDARPEETQWAWAWTDAHLSLAEHEPTSWLTPEGVTATIRTAGSAQVCKGFKTNTPAGTSLRDKLTWVRHVREAMFST